MEDFEREFEKNIYVIRRKLAEQRMLKGEESWTMYIGDFILLIKPTNKDFWRVTNNLANRDAVRSFKIIDFEKLDIDLYEGSRRDPSLRNYIDISRDSRFKNHVPIQYDVIETPTGGRITHNSNGKDIPILYLCELIKHLYRLSNLAVFT